VRPGALALLTTVALGVAWLLRRGTGGSGRRATARPGHGDIGPAAAFAAGPNPPFAEEQPWEGTRMDTADLPSLPADFHVPDAPPVLDPARRDDDESAGGWLHLPGQHPPFGTRATTDAGTSVHGGPAPTAAKRFGALRVEHPAVHVLHDLCIPKSPARIDHVLVGPGGVVVANTKDYAGRVRSNGIDLRVRGRNRSAAVDVCLWQAETVRALLDRAGLGLVPVHGVLHWLRPGGLGAERIDLRGVRLLTARETMDVATGSDLLDPEVAERVALLLRSTFPVA
jgi:hypothetical protein